MDKLIRVLLADDNRDLIEVLKAYIQSQDDMELVGVAYNGNKALELIDHEFPDVIVLDIIMPHLDGLGVLEKLRYEEQRPRVIILSAYGQELMIQRVVSLGADYYMLKPFDLETLGKRIRQLADKTTLISSTGPSPINSGIAQEVNVVPKTSAKNWEVEVTSMMHQMNVPPHVKGYQYLRDSIVSVIQEVSLLDAVTKELYPMIADKYHTTPSRVERGIRHAIELAWNRSNVEIKNRLFGYIVSVERGKPANSEFIAMVAEKLKMLKFE